MPRFIPGAKLKQLREAAKGGDSRAKAVLMAQMDDSSDFDTIFNEYFTEPEIEVQGDAEIEQELEPQNDTPLLTKFLSDNGVQEGDDDYDETVEEFYQEFPKLRHKEENAPAPEMCGCSLADKFKDLIADENEAIAGYDEVILMVSNDLEMNNDTKTVLLTTLQSIKEDELEHVSILMEKLKKIDKKRETTDVVE